MKWLILLLLTNVAFAQDFYYLSDEEKNPDTQEALIKKPEKYMRHESMIYDLNSDLGIKDQRRYTGADKNKFSLAGHLNGNYEQLTDILGLELNYMHRSERYDRLWYGAQFFQHRTYFDAITQNSTATSSDPNAEANIRRPADSKASVLGLGLGVGYRFKLLLDFFQTEDVFESIEVFGNYITMDEKFIGESYAGYGLTTNYGIHKRSSTRYFYGGKLSYNLASVTREAIGNEGKSDRSFALGWLTFGFEMGFFF